MSHTTIPSDGVEADEFGFVTDSNGTRYQEGANGQLRRVGEKRNNPNRERKLRIMQAALDQMKEQNDPDSQTEGQAPVDQAIHSQPLACEPA